jgi:hypothetical protein
MTPGVIISNVVAQSTEPQVKGMNRESELMGPADLAEEL